ncbi:hypothetical protein [Flavobacterium panacagri]|uniref:hypothetical protein n=1 Tax=Flavobacterium panacagri TaxID=3034146 RepID=UPI0025A5482D|nr:hypothetical protein [Flavobacterium panacagri]
MVFRNYVVTGEDVNDFMVMEDSAYISYTLRLLHHFLFSNGFSKQKLNSMNLDLEGGNHELICYKKLMFTEPFLVELKHCYVKDKIYLKSCFFNSKNECCTEVTKEVKWLNQTNREIIKTPKYILNHLSKNIVQI